MSFTIPVQQPNNILVNDVMNKHTTVLTLLQNLTNNYTSQASYALDRMSNTINSISFNPNSIDTKIDSILADITIDEGRFNNIDAKVQNYLTSLDSLIAVIFNTELPNIPSKTFDDITEPASIEEEVDSLKNEVDTFLNTNLISEVSNLQAYGVEEAKQKAKKALQEVQEEFGTLGYQLPNGVFLAKIADVEKSLGSTVADIQAKMMERKIDLVVENKRSALDRKVAVTELKLRAVSEVFANKIKYIMSQMDIYKNEIGIQFQLIESKLNLFRSQAEAYATASQTLKGLSDSLISIVEGKTELIKTKVNAYIQGITTKIDWFGKQLGVEVELAKFMPTIYAQLGASAMQTLNISTTLSAGFSSSISGGHHSQETVEHYIDETPA